MSINYDFKNKTKYYLTKWGQKFTRYKFTDYWSCTGTLCAKRYEDSYIISGYVLNKYDERFNVVSLLLNGIKDQLGYNADVSYAKETDEYKIYEVIIPQDVAEAFYIQHFLMEDKHGN